MVMRQRERIESIVRWVSVILGCRWRRKVGKRIIKFVMVLMDKEH